jgi:hypothetical protein
MKLYYDYGFDFRLDSRMFVAYPKLPYLKEFIAL